MEGHIAIYAETEHLTPSLVIWEYHDHYRQSSNAAPPPLQQ
jgi:hypothetical protein